MKFLTLADGIKVQVSDDIYYTPNPTCHSRVPTLWRLIGGTCEGQLTPGWHYDYKNGWRCLIKLSNCYDGVHRLPYTNGIAESIYCGLHEKEFRLFNTHPLNRKG